MAIAYVSNQAINGYSLGNNGTAVKGNPALPFLTHVAALAACTASVDEIYTNPTPTAYAETSGSGYFNFNKNGIAMQTDPALVGTAGKATLTFSSAGRVVNFGANNLTLKNYIIDEQGGTANVITVAAITGGLLELLDFINVGANATAIYLSATGVQNGTIRKCTISRTGSTAATARLAGPAVASGASADWTFEGCSATGVQGLFYTSITSGAFGSYKFKKAADGTRNTIDNCTFGIRQPGGTATVVEMNVQDTDFVNMTDAGGSGYYDGGIPSAVTSTFVYKNNTYNGTQPRAVYISASSSNWLVDGNTFILSGASRAITTRNSAINSGIIQNNSFTGTSMTVDLVELAMIGSGLQVLLNYFSSDATNAHHLSIGGDGYYISATNSAGTISQRNLGSASTNKWLSCKFQTVANNATYNLTKAAAIQVYMRKVGSPTGVVTGYIYTDNAGVPGTLVDTATFTLPANPTFATPSTVEFYFKNFPTLSYSTAYHLVLMNSVVDASNYWQVDQGTVVGSGDGSIQGVGFSSNGTAWTSDATKSFKMQLCQLNREATNPIVMGNTFDSTMTATTGALQHMVIFNGVDGGLFDKNVMPTSQGIGILFKLCTNCKGRLNLIHLNKGGDSSGQILRNKGSDGVEFYANSVIVTKSAAVCFNADSDYISSGVFSPSFNGRIAENTTVRNNILYRDSDTAGWIFQLGNANPNATNYSGFTETNNAVYVGANTPVARVASTNYDQSGWTGLGFGTNDVYTNPGFKAMPPTQATDFVATGLALKGAGYNLTSTIPNDFAGNAFTNPPDIGAYNVVSTTPPRAVGRPLTGRLTQGRFIGRALS